MNHKPRFSPQVLAATTSPTRWWVLALALLLCGLWFATTTALAAPGDTRLKRTAAEWSEEGLQPVRVRGLDLVYVRDGANLAGYRQVWLKSIDIAFRSDWPDERGPGSRISADDRAVLKSRLENVLREQAARELGLGGYRVVEGPGEGVLALEVSIVDLYLNAPDVPSSTRVDRYARSVGEMTLVAALHDAASGTLVGRALDRREDRDLGHFELVTSVQNTAAAQRVARDWARILRRQLDAARQGGGSTSP